MQPAAETQVRTVFLGENAQGPSSSTKSTCFHDWQAQIVSANSLQNISLTLHLFWAVCNNISFSLPWFTLQIEKAPSLFTRAEINMDRHQNQRSHPLSSSQVNIQPWHWKHDTKLPTLLQNNQVCADLHLVMAAPLSPCSTWEREQQLVYTNAKCAFWS